MSSRRGMGRLTVTVPSPMRFKKRASQFNACVGAELRDKRYTRPAPGTGGRRDQRIQSAFRAAVNQCKGRRSFDRLGTGGAI